MNNITLTDFTPFILSLKVAGMTTLILFIVSIPIAWKLAYSKSIFKSVIEAVIFLSIILPPSVLGFYFLIIFSSMGEMFNVELIFNFTGIVLVSCFSSLPFMVKPIQQRFEKFNKDDLKKNIFFKIKVSLFIAIMLTFTHALGSFGVVLMVGGSIPDETKVASVAIYEMVEIMDYGNARIYSSIMILISFISLYTAYILNQQYNKK